MKPLYVLIAKPLLAVEKCDIQVFNNFEKYKESILNSLQGRKDKVRFYTWVELF